MNIFFVLLIALSVVAMFEMLISICCLVINIYMDDDKFIMIIKRSLPWAIVVGILVVLLTIGIGTSNETVYITKYEAQKITIEQSLTSDVLTGLERVELVKQASELNGELAEKKARCKLWYYVYFNRHLYDNVEYINLGTGEVNSVGNS